MNNKFIINQASIIFLIIGLLVGFGVGWYVSNLNGDNTPTKEEVSETDTETSVSKNDLSVSDQPAGLTVLIDSVSLKEPKWIAVREDINGEMGNILGALRLQEGAHEGVEVELLRGTNPEELYYVVLYEDNGGDTFDHNFDSLITSEAEEPVLTTFIAN